MVVHPGLYHATGNVPSSLYQVHIGCIEQIADSRAVPGSPVAFVAGAGWNVRLGGRRPAAVGQGLAEHRPDIRSAAPKTPVADDPEAEGRIEGEVRHRRRLEE